MFFTIYGAQSRTALTKSRAIISARKRILFYPFGCNEIIMNNYLLNTYHMGLRAMCIKLFANCTWSTDQDGNITVTFKTQKFDKIASLITYGNGKMQGSSILTFAFHRDE